MGKLSKIEGRGEVKRLQRMVLRKLLLMVRILSVSTEKRQWVDKLSKIEGRGEAKRLQRMVLRLWSSCLQVALDRI